MDERRGWWRRNWWGLVAVAPMLVAAFLLSPTDSYDWWRAAELRDPVAAGPDEWVSYGGTRIRLAALEPADLRDRANPEEPFALPPGLRAWRATVSFGRLEDPDFDLLSCKLLLEDRAGRRFAEGPTEVQDARIGPDGPAVPAFGSQCRPGVDGPDPGAADYDVTVVFVLPASAEPAALLVTVTGELPTYVRFGVG